MKTEVTLSLAPLDSTDLGLVRTWRNDPRIYRWCRQHTLISDAEQVRWFNRQSDDPSIQMFKIVLSTPEKSGPVGVGGLTSIDLVNRRAEFSLYVAPSAQGKGIGKRALELLLDYGFDALGLNLIWGETFDGNPALTMFEALGFRREGARRQFYFRDGKFIDAHLVSINAEEWRGTRGLLGAGASRGVSLDGGVESSPGGAPSVEDAEPNNVKRFPERSGSRDTDPLPPAA